MGRKVFVLWPPLRGSPRLKAPCPHSHSGPLSLQLLLCPLYPAALIGPPTSVLPLWPLNLCAWLTPTLVLPVSCQDQLVWQELWGQPPTLNGPASILERQQGQVQAHLRSRLMCAPQNLGIVCDGSHGCTWTLHLDSDTGAPALWSTRQGQEVRDEVCVGSEQGHQGQEGHPGRRRYR